MRWKFSESQQFVERFNIGNMDKSELHNKVNLFEIIYMAEREISLLYLSLLLRIQNGPCSVKDAAYFNPLL